MKLGDRVICKAYLNRVKDGAYIEKIDGDRTVNGECAYLLHPSNRNPQALEDFYKKLDNVFGNNPFDIDFPFEKIDTQKEPEMFSQMDGGYDVEKTYFERIKKNFRGVAVGIKEVVAEGYLWVDEGIYYTTIRKTAKTVIKCAIVYYAFGKSRLVPLDDLEAEYGNQP